ncbi:MAG: cytochrome P450 [Pseudomonadota bacterium]
MAEAHEFVHPDPLDPSNSALYTSSDHWDVFQTLRREDPVHFTEESPFGPYWSITKFEDIKHVDTNHNLFSSEPAIVIGDLPPEQTLAQFIAMDPPRHDQQRKDVAGAVAPSQLANLEPLIRERIQGLLDNLPIGETFDWVDTVSIELTTQMLATLFDFPFEDRRKLTGWSDAATSSPALVGASNMTDDERMAELMDCLEYFNRLWKEREGGDGMDFVSMMTRSPAFKGMEPMEYLGNLILLIVGGNDTTRNSISGGLYALNRFPEQFDRLRTDHSLIPNMVAEIIRWQTPLSHMRRIATEDSIIGGKTIRAGDKVVMWYISGNRDEDIFDQADHLQIDRANARQHVSFGYGIHRCMGNRLGELQLKIVWEEILKRFEHIEVMQEPERVHSNFVHGYKYMPVQVHPL